MNEGKIVASIVAFFVATAIPKLLHMSPDATRQLIMPVFISMNIAIWAKRKVLKSRFIAGLTGGIISFVIAIAVIYAVRPLAQQTGLDHVAANSPDLANILSFFLPAIEMILPTIVTRRMLIDIGPLGA